LAREAAILRVFFMDSGMDSPVLLWGSMMHWPGCMVWAREPLIWQMTSCGTW
jgi:hypothetical protein